MSYLIFGWFVHNFIFELFSYVAPSGLALRGCSFFFVGACPYAVLCRPFGACVAGVFFFFVPTGRDAVLCRPIGAIFSSSMFFLCGYRQVGIDLPIVPIFSRRGRPDKSGCKPLRTRTAPANTRRHLRTYEGWR